VREVELLFNPLMDTDNHSATSNNMKMVHWPLMGGQLHLVQRGGDWMGCDPAQSPPRCTKRNIPSINGQRINHPLAVYGPLLCGCNVPTKGLKQYILFNETFCS